LNFVVSPGEMEEWEIFPGSKVRLAARGEKMTAVLSKWEPGSQSTLHSHPNEQIAFCLEGAMIFKIGDREYTARKGDVVLIPAEIPHNQRNEGAEPALFAECFSPVREDLLRKDFAPLRRKTSE
jgi:quercetin dioxygenase-like cupin family protein